MELKLRQEQTPGQAAPAPNRTGIPTQMKLDLERRAGLPLDEVRVHYNSDRPARLGALAYTYGPQVYLGPGQERHLRHELGHVVQQKQGLVRPTAVAGGLPVNDDQGLEREADALPVRRPAGPEGAPVVQKMPLPILPGQSGPNCGFHALARAMMGVAGFSDPGLPDSLTAFAARCGLTVVGEAFDPFALALAGNFYCGRLEGEAQRLRGVRCRTETFSSPDELSKILQRNKDGVVLVPYFPGQTDASKPFLPEKAEGSPNAHWAAIDPASKTGPAEGGTPSNTSYEMYEGNYYGVQGEKSAAPVSVQDLFDSNLSLKEEFDWVRDYLAPEGALDEPESREQIQKDFQMQWAKYRDPNEEAPPLDWAVARRMAALGKPARFNELRRPEAARGQAEKPGPAPAPAPKEYSVAEPVSLKGTVVIVRK